MLICTSTRARRQGMEQKLLERLVTKQKETSGWQSNQGKMLEKKITEIVQTWLKTKEKDVQLLKLYKKSIFDENLQSVCEIDYYLKQLKMINVFSTLLKQNNMSMTKIS